VKTVTSFADTSASRMFDYAIKAFGLESVVDTPRPSPKHSISERIRRFTSTIRDRQAVSRIPDGLRFCRKGSKATSDKAMMQQTGSS
jgi:hypothetical protein